MKEELIFDQNECKIFFKVNSQWEKGVESQIIINNDSDRDLENWKISFNFDHEITSIWDAEVASHKGTNYVIKHPSWNAIIPAKGKVIIGFISNADGKINLPNNCILLNETSERPKEDYTINYKTTSDWKDSFNGEITITNNTQKSIEGWELQFVFNADIRQIWNAKLLNKSGNTYKIKNDEWNSIIKHGQSVKFGFEAYPGNINFTPADFVLTSSSDSEDVVQDPDIEDGEEEDFTKDSDKDGLPDIYELELGTDVNKVDTDEDGLSDYEEVELTFTNPLVKDTATIIF